MSTPRDQPSGVATNNDDVRPDDTHVTTTDLPSNVVADPPDGDKGKQDPAAATPPGEGSNDQGSAPGSKTTSSDESETQSRPRRRGRSAERRIAKLTDQLEQSRKQGEATAAELAALRQEIDEIKQATPATPRRPEPKIEDYDNPRDYAKAYTQWEAGKGSPARSTSGKPPADSKPPADRNPPAQQQQEGSLDDKEIQGFRERGKAKLGDEFDQAMQDTGAAVNQLMGEYMIDSDVGPEIYVHLVNNPEEARKIYDASPVRAMKALDKLATRAAQGDLDVGDDEEINIENEADTSGQDTQPKGKGSGTKTTKAPEPPDTSGGGSPNMKPDPESESMDDYAARRRKEIARSRGYPV